MSNYLKTAAMSLLSKTLQTFLTKYLSDVDVEGVTLPSIDGSGWGVRLSNVQLREGVQLMEKMPGTVKRNRKIKRKRTKRRKIPKQQIPPKASALLPQDEPSSSSNEPLKDTPGKTDHALRPRISSQVSVDEIEIDSTVAADYYTDDELEYDESGNPIPATPAQRPNGMFTCFYKKSKPGDSKVSDHSLHHKSEEIVVADIPSRFSKDVEVSPHDPTNSEEVATESNKARDIETIVVDDGEEYEYYEEEEEFEEEHELPLKLCLGEDGRIGMIDVRLIGKDLHIMVEDAMVTIEAIPLVVDETLDDTAKMETNGDDNNDGTTESARNTSTKSENAVDSEITDDPTSENGSGKKTKNSAPKRDTVYDRVIADNGLARLISSIPHLFLRDVRIRLITRDEPTTTSMNGKDGDSQTDPDSHHSNTDGYTTPTSSSKDTMVEVGIDFLTVTSGEDILSYFQEAHSTTEDGSQLLNASYNYLDETNHSKRSDTSFTKPPSLLKIPSNVVDATGEQKNEYLVRQIRTGRGPSGGLYVQIFTPKSNVSKLVTTHSLSSGILWARQHWISSTEHYLLRCSGVDIQARIHMGTKRVDAGYSWFYGDYVEGQDDGSEIDSLILFGGAMDNIAPGPQLPLPPVEPSPPPEPRMSRGGSPKRSGMDDILSDDEYEPNGTEKPGSMHPGVDTFSVDANGIQSCKIPSLFHRVSRGMELRSCKQCKHLPSEVCDLCWEVPAESEIKKTSPLDSSMPMPGLALQISIRDPLEVNIDRNNIESIGLIKSLFSKPLDVKAAKSTSNDDSGQKQGSAETTTSMSHTEDTTQTTTTSTGFFSGLLYSRPEQTIQEEADITDSFEPYMQPESISAMGIYLAEVTIRVHVMREDQNDRHLSFCYWQIDMNCFTLDRQSLTAVEKHFSDLQIDVGRIMCDEYKGTKRKNIASLGVFQGFSNRYRSESNTSLSSLIDDHANNKTPWPSTACALLDIRPPPESLGYKSREGHGIQFRFVSTPSTFSGPNQASRSLIHLRLGLTKVDSSWEIRKEIGLVINEIWNNMFGQREAPPKTADNEKEQEILAEDEEDKHSTTIERGVESPKPQFLMTYTVQVDSGNISLPPLIQVRMPLTRFSGERSSLAGFSIESILGKLDFSYGQKEIPYRRRCLSLPQIAALPENVRMHILLCLQDIGPLEKALNVKIENNSFRRIKAVDKAIQKTAKKITKKNAKNANKKKSQTQQSSSSLSRGSLLLNSANSRQTILSEIMKLDDEELTNLWSVHLRYQKKLAQKLKGSQGD